jgi:hypothetical protein
MAVAKVEYEATVRLVLIKMGKTDLTKEELTEAVLEIEQEVNNMPLQPTKKIKKYLNIHLDKEKTKGETSGDNQDKDLA